MRAGMQVYLIVSLSRYLLLQARFNHWHDYIIVKQLSGLPFLLLLFVAKLPILSYSRLLFDTQIPKGRE